MFNQTNVEHINNVKQVKLEIVDRFDIKTLARDIPVADNKKSLNTLVMRE